LLQEKYNILSISNRPDNWYDYGARFYDPQIGRWNVIDGKAEKHLNQSSYLYCNGNPVIYMDPNGQDGVITIKGGQAAISSNIFCMEQVLVNQ
jgi:RHS repeat-associated protein